MSIFSISDLHLSTTSEKPMDVFGHRWHLYMEKLRRNWHAIVSDEDYVIIPGDISWAMTLEGAEGDFRFLESLPGKKLIGKGNHDLWWQTLTKMERFFAEKSINSISFLHNNAYHIGDYILCGTRGWYMEERLQNTTMPTDFKKISLRETTRLRNSLECARKIQNTPSGAGCPILVFMHFPPVFGDFYCADIVSILKEYQVAHLYYGHIHGIYHIPGTSVFDGIPMSIISADYLNFIPMLTNPLDL